MVLPCPTSSCGDSWHEPLRGARRLPRVTAPASRVLRGAPRAGGCLRAARPKPVLCPRVPAGGPYTCYVLGHLKHHLRLQCPEELGVVMREMSLNRRKELIVGAACELRPALTVSYPTLALDDRPHLA
jgi:hypothetical protein